MRVAIEWRSTKLRWVGIDEAGYGPNLGPLVMTAVTAERSANQDAAVESSWLDPPDLWRDLARTIDRAGGNPASLWVDDSKRILVGGKGRDRLETTCLCLLQTVGHSIPGNFVELLGIVGAGNAEEAELSHWQPDDQAVAEWPIRQVREAVRAAMTRRALQPETGEWRISAVRAVVVGPARFNRGLDRLGSKAKVHFTAFQELLEATWDIAADGVPTAVAGDKHGGRHYYLEPLCQAFPRIWIERGREGPGLSEYQLKGQGRQLRLSLSPRADQSNALVALASIVSKTIRELWMDAFNACWASRIDGLRPTAGYPVDALRFRLAIEPIAFASGLHPDLWWRKK